MFGCPVDYTKGTMKPSLLIPFLLLCVSATLAFAEPDPPQPPAAASSWNDHWKQAKDDWRDIGQRIKDTGVQIGQGLKTEFRQMPSNFRTGIEAVKKDLKSVSSPPENPLPKK